jgi:hypothetical protein
MKKLTLADVRVDPAEKYGAFDLEKVFGKKVKRVEGSVSGEFGRDTLVFQLHSIVFEDDEKIFVEGEHDCPYIPGDNHEETLKALYDEENGPEEKEEDDDD